MADTNLTSLDTVTLKINGTALTGTAAEINSGIQPAAAGTDGLGRRGVARFTYDATANAALRTAAAHGTGVTLPINAVVIGGFYDVNTALTSTNSTAQVAISVEAANDILTATAVSNAILGTIGRKAIVPKNNTPESTSVKATASREITVTITVEAILGGKITGFLEYVVSAVSA